MALNLFSWFSCLSWLKYLSCVFQKIWGKGSSEEGGFFCPLFHGSLKLISLPPLGGVRRGTPPVKHDKRMKQKLICTQGNLYTPPGATRHPLLKKGAREAPFLGRGCPKGGGCVHRRYLHIPIIHKIAFHAFAVSGRGE